MQDKLEELDMSSRQEDDSEDCVILINLNPMGSHHIFSSWYLKNHIYLINTIYPDENILKITGNNLTNFLLYGDVQFVSNKHTRLLNTTIRYIIDSAKFTVPLV